LQREHLSEVSRTHDDDEYYGQQNSYYFNEGIDSTGQEANQLQQLSQKHNQYQDEIEKIKAMLGND
jgi:hypothetical protein